MNHHAVSIAGEEVAVSRAIAAATSLHETLNAANPSLERESALCATCQHLIGSQLVKLWSKVQKWLNKRGRIGNWTGIKFLIN